MPSSFDSLHSIRHSLHRLLPERLRRARVALDQLLYPPDFSKDEVRLCEAVASYTMTGLERIVELHRAVRHLGTLGLRGDIVECGVWRGGSMMVVAQTLVEAGDTERDLHLYDTFEGMTAPTAEDRTYRAESAAQLLARTRREVGASLWCWATEEDVRRNVLSTGYPASRVHIVKGPVEETLPGHLPEAISLLRLDTDWYRSTKHELVHLYPRVVPGGFVMVDDYGHWQGARKAVDEYFAENGLRPFLHRVDYSCRLFVKEST